MSFKILVIFVSLNPKIRSGMLEELKISIFGYFSVKYLVILVNVNPQIGSGMLDELEIVIVRIFFQRI